MLGVWLSLVLGLVLAQDCFDLNYPEQYVAYKLQPGEKIVFDGVLDEPAWDAVGWTKKFVDIVGPSKPAPYYNTQAKMRYNHEFLIIGALLEEPGLFANNTVNNSIIFYDNDFEVFICTDGSNHFYKELEINGRNLNWNLILARPYLNGGPAVCNWTVPGMCQLSAPEFGIPWWDIAPQLASGVFVSGEINNPAVGTKYWSVEIGIPIKEYIRYSRSKTPRHGDYWRLDFSRVEWHTKVVNQNGQLIYEKLPGVPEENWVWSPMGVVNMHLPERWGYVQFSEEPVNTTALKKDPTWATRDALMQVYYALTEYQSKYKKYTTDLLELVATAGLPRYVAEGLCASIPRIHLSDQEPLFVVEVKNGRVRNDRFLWFD